MINTLYLENYPTTGFRFDSYKVALLNKSDTIYLKPNNTYNFEVKLVSSAQEYYLKRIISINGMEPLETSQIEIQTVELSDTLITYPVHLKIYDGFRDIKSYIKDFYFQVIH